MYICLCKGLDEKSLEELRLQGVDSLKKVIKACGAGGDCGTCAFKINRYLQDSDKKDKADTYIPEKIKKAK